MTKIDTIVYHYPCWDGLTAGWVCRKMYPEAELVPQDYDSQLDIESLRGKRVLMVDYCPDKETFERLVEVVEHLTLLDHHKGAQETLEDFEHPNCDITFDMKRSGAGLAWDHLMSPLPRPPLVRCVEDRDLWKFQHVDTKAFCAALDRYPLTFEAMDEVALMDAGRLVMIGQPVVEHIEASARKIGDRAHYAYTPKGTRVLLVNGTKELASAIGDYLNKEDPTVPAVIWFHHNDSGFKLSIRSNNGTGVSALELSREFGGGGHPSAAGATAKKCPAEWRTRLPLNVSQAGLGGDFKMNIVCVPQGKSRYYILPGAVSDIVEYDQHWISNFRGSGRHLVFRCPREALGVECMACDKAKDESINREDRKRYMAVTRRMVQAIDVRSQQLVYLSLPNSTYRTLVRLRSTVDPSLEVIPVDIYRSEGPFSTYSVKLVTTGHLEDWVLEVAKTARTRHPYIPAHSIDDVEETSGHALEVR